MCVADAKGSAITVGPGLSLVVSPFNLYSYLLTNHNFVFQIVIVLCYSKAFSWLSYFSLLCSANC
jgi:hypothetical protein